jgi:geranylgeranyl diphosphate synthase type I
MCEGQSLDLYFESERSVTLPDYYRMIECKTAQLFDASCRLGAHAAGCAQATIDDYGAVGRAYGMAFQIRDDVAGIWSSVDETGKTVASDIARRKWTFPVVWAIAQRPSPARAVVVEAYSRGGSLDTVTIDGIVAALNTLGAREAAEQAAAEHLAVLESHQNRELREFLTGTLGLAAAS